MTKWNWKVKIFILWDQEVLTIFKKSGLFILKINFKMKFVSINSSDNYQPSTVGRNKILIYK